MPQNNFAIPIDADLVIEVEYEMSEGSPMPFVVRLIGKCNGEKPAFQGMTARIHKNHLTVTFWGFEQVLSGKFFMKRSTTETQLLMLF